MMTRMRVALLFFLIAATPLRSQTLIDPSRARRAIRLLEPQPGEKPLRCEVTPIQPTLNFGFRFQAGYMVRVPMEQYLGPGHRWAIFTRVTPEEGGKPVYFGANLRLPEVPKTKNLIEVGGGYQAGRRSLSGSLGVDGRLGPRLPQGLDHRCQAQSQRARR